MTDRSTKFTFQRNIYFSGKLLFLHSIVKFSTILFPFHMKTQTWPGLPVSVTLVNVEQLREHISLVAVTLFSCG